MSYRNLRECLSDLERTNQLVRIEEEIDPYLEAAEIQRRIYQAGGPAVYYARVKNCSFPMVSNLFGTLERAQYMFRDTLDSVRRLLDLRLDPWDMLRRPWHYRGVPQLAWHAHPKKTRKGPILAHRTTIDQLPQLHCWPDDGGAFITLPVVYTEDPDRPGFTHSNLGMYRVQISGGQFDKNRQVGLHYQLHRGIGGHHAAAIRKNERLQVNIFVGGTPAMMLGAVMPLPEGVSELFLAGAMGGRRVPMVVSQNHLPIYAEADFCITGTIAPDELLPEGPFGDHLGYYSLQHDFPVLRVDNVYHRSDAIWPFTVVGRPPQEDTTFGKLIHEITGPAIPAVVPGVHAVHAVDAAGVHPLLLAIGSERYVPYEERRKPRELLTCANAILGQGQLSLAKFLWLAACEDNPALNVSDVSGFLTHMLERVDWETDLHFHTRTTIDTLDYSGTALNEGSKVVIAAAGPKRRDLPAALPSSLRLPDGFSEPRVCSPGILAVQAPPSSLNAEGQDDTAMVFCNAVSTDDAINAFPLVVLVDDSELTSRSLTNFLWVTFTRSDPARDVTGIGATSRDKHWGCRGALVIDARIKPHHAPPVVEDPGVTRRVDALAAPGGPLHGLI